jgi:hypothetical protein
MSSSKSNPSPRITSTGLPRVLACVTSRAASAAKLRLERLEQALLDAVPEHGDERELEEHVADALRWA